MQSFPDPYRVLGISSSANIEEIKKAYRQLAKRYHPDVVQTPASTQRFIEVDHAYKTLIDPVKRREYDNQRSAQGQFKTPSPSSHKASHVGYEWQTKSSWQGTYSTSYGEQTKSSWQNAYSSSYSGQTEWSSQGTYRTYEWNTPQDEWRGRQTASSMSYTANTMRYHTDENSGCFYLYAAFIMYCCISTVLAILFPTTITIIKTGFDQDKVTQNINWVIFKNDLHISVTLCLGSNQHCDVHATDPKELASPGLIMLPGSSKQIAFASGAEYHITIVSPSNTLPYANFDLTIEPNDPGGYSGRNSGPTCFQGPCLGEARNLSWFTGSKVTFFSSA